MNAYVDQNFLINCANDPLLRQAASDAVRTQIVSFVLSPWHFYEVGNVDSKRGDEIVDVAEKLNPKWILDRSDLQLGEFRQEWNRFWGMPHYLFAPIASLQEVASALLRKPASSLTNFGLADYAKVFRVLARRNLMPELDHQQTIVAANQASVRDGRMTPEVVERIKESYLELMLGRIGETGPDEEELRGRIRAIQNDSFTTGMIRYFMRQGGMKSLRAWEVESILTEHHHSGLGKLDHNKQLDRQHAVAALAYCDRFITDDRKLLTLCREVRKLAKFEVPEAQSAESFFASLNPPALGG